MAMLPELAQHLVGSGWMIMHGLGPTQEAPIWSKSRGQGDVLTHRLPLLLSYRVIGLGAGPCLRHRPIIGDREDATLELRDDLRGALAYQTYRELYTITAWRRKLCSRGLRVGVRPQMAH